MSSTRRYLSSKRSESLLSSTDKRVQIMQHFAKAEFVQDYQYTDLLLVDIYPIDTIQEISQIVEHLSSKTPRFIEEYYQDLAQCQFDLASNAGEEDLLIVFSVICDYLTAKYSLLTPKVIVTPMRIAKYPRLERIEVDMARLIAIFFHYIGINPHLFELMCWTSYRYDADEWLDQELSIRPKKQIVI